MSFNKHLFLSVSFVCTDEPGTTNKVLTIADLHDFFFLFPLTSEASASYNLFWLASDWLANVHVLLTWLLRLTFCPQPAGYWSVHLLCSHEGERFDMLASAVYLLAMQFWSFHQSWTHFTPSRNSHLIDALNLLFLVNIIEFVQTAIWIFFFSDFLIWDDPALAIYGR